MLGTRDQSAHEMRNGAQRVIIAGVSPEIDAGRFAVKRTVQDTVVVEADIFADGHDQIGAVVRYQESGNVAWRESSMQPLGNDRWQGAFQLTSLGTCVFTIHAWIDTFGSWRRNLEKRFAAGQDLEVELKIGQTLLLAAAEQAPETERKQLREMAHALAQEAPTAAGYTIAISPGLAALMRRNAPRLNVSEYERLLPIEVDPLLAEFSAWYELFPRSCAPEPGRHGTLRDCAAMLPRVARLGFDIVYLPPIHPIGHTFRKGKNNSLQPLPTDPGSPWAIGSEDGGHKSIHSALGTLEDFHHLVQTARSLQLEIALDVAFQCSPDHPYVTEHPEWFRHRPDGSIQYAENPPKKYQDIYPFDFESPAWPELWQELKTIFEFWIAAGVRVFRVDNPHTKSFRFWAWCLASLKKQHPELIFLAEAFTRPKVMYHLAKIGFNQSYNYFPWRNHSAELTQYFTELTRTDVHEFFRPNLWPNTPDILPEYLQAGGRPAFLVRLILAATLGSSYGIYGPPFETLEITPREPGSEEYLNSEKYEIRQWQLDPPGTLGEVIARINRIRKNNPALHRNRSLTFHATSNDQLLAYSKQTEDGKNLILVIVNLDPHHTQRGTVTLPIEKWGIPRGTTFQFHDQLTEARYLWSARDNYVELDPRLVPAHVLLLHRHLRTEYDFDYFL